MKLTTEELEEGLDKAYKEAGNNAYFGEGFFKGITFVLEKIQQEKNKVSVYKNGMIGTSSGYMEGWDMADARIIHLDNGLIKVEVFEETQMSGKGYKIREDYNFRKAYLKKVLDAMGVGVFKIDTGESDSGRFVFYNEDKID